MTAQKFWSLVKKGKSDDCWLWTGYTDKDGYGKLFIFNKWMYAHRVSWILAFGEILKSKLCVLHHCDNTSCVNPGHLFIGVRLDNINDMVLKGRSNFGEKNPNAKLSVEIVSTIREIYCTDRLSYRELGRRFNIHPSTVGRIVNKERWTSVTK